MRGFIRTGLSSCKIVQIWSTQEGKCLQVSLIVLMKRELFPKMSKLFARYMDFQ